ncbi:Enhancer of rudimentary-like protein [Aphelenchoides besseyi]|nr:Enhancer of rudimentary-like protein [Aphelenchoides besseyi]KAI6200309.1 Enhancer of rudimentary-like protein [Aphelenchoides besseyi]
MHTILLIQSTNKPDSRTWSDYETVEICMEAVCKIYEEHLKKCYPSENAIAYDIGEFFQFLDRFGDISCMVFDAHRQVYIPKSRDWIKDQLYLLLRHRSAA